MDLAITEKVRALRPQFPDASTRNRAVQRPLPDSLLRAAVEDCGEINVGLDAEDIFGYALGDHEAQSSTLDCGSEENLVTELFTGQARLPNKSLPCAPMAPLSDRLISLMAERGMDAPTLAERAGVSKQTIYNLVNGATSKDKVRAATLFDVAQVLRADPYWLLYGVAGPRHESQPARIDHAILTSAKRLIVAEEEIGGLYERDELVDRVIAAYELLVQSGGQLTAEDREARIKSALKRRNLIGGTNATPTGVGSN